MSTSTPNPEITKRISNDRKWHAELTQLREIMLQNGLTEELKWGQPCYAAHGANILLLHTFKEYCAVLFFKGALLQDPAGILIQQTENVQARRQLRFTSLKDIQHHEDTLKNYVQEAIAIEQAGLQVPLKKTDDFPMPEELLAKLEQNPDLKEAFENLTPGRQRAYLLHINAAKQSKTREARVEKHTPRILAGKGLDD